MSDERGQLETTIAGLAAQRGLLGDAIVDAALGPLRTRLAALVPAPSPAAGRALRQVSMLFIDAVGSTALSGSLDPEDVSEVLDGLMARCTSLVHAEGGRVMVYAGDGLLAAFGADRAQEDDAERAVRCGLALLIAGAAAGEDVQRRFGWDGFSMRAGVHTGGVLLGGGVDGDGTIRGEAVNIAARMEQAAPPGCLRISHDTYRLVRGVFDVEPQSPIRVKGVAEPLLTYLVRALKPRAFRVAARGVEGVETRMVGRAAELRTLQAAFRRVFAERRLAAVSVIGEAGLGKSRLLYEFSNWAEALPERYVLFQGRATPQTPGQPYGLLRDVLAWRFGLADREGMDAAKAKLEDGLMPLFEPHAGRDAAQGQAHLLGYLIGLDYGGSRHVRGIREDQRQIRDRAFHAATEMFRRMTADAPALLLLEDLHWADEGSLEFLSHLGQAAGDVPLLVVGLARPMLSEREGEWIEGAPCTRVELQPLGKDLSRDLANELLKKLPAVPPALEELISGGAEGNPFYMEELVKMLIDQRAIEASDAVWNLDAERLLAARVPPTLTGVLQARLDSLPPAERHALQAASVIGLVFWDQALAALDPRSPAALPSLARRELAVARPDAAVAGMREYAFKHQILHQVTYGTVLKPSRRALHAQAAAWFTSLDGGRGAQFAAQAAGHYAEAGDGARACEHFARAAENALERYAGGPALDFANKAFAQLGAVTAGVERNKQQRRLLDLRERTFDLQGRRDEQLAALDAMAALAEASGDDANRADIAWRRAYRAVRMGDWQAVQDAARTSLACAKAAGDPSRRLNAQRLLADAIGKTGDLASGLALAEAGLAEVRARGLREIEAGYCNALSMLAGLAGDTAGGLAWNLETLAIVLEFGDPRKELIVRTNVAQQYVEFGRYTDAARQAEAALRIARLTGDRVFEGVALIRVSECELLAGQAERARTHAAASLAIAVETDSRGDEIEALLALGEAELALNSDANAAARFARAAGLAAEMGGMYLPDALAWQARAALARGDSGAALSILEPVLGADQPQGMANRPHLVRLICWQALTAAEDARAGPALTVAHELLQAEAASVTDPNLRRGLLEDHPTSAAIIAAWQAAR